MSAGSALLLRADARRLPLADESVDLVVTSPPYWALRDYRDGTGSLAGQIGSEAHWRDWLAALVACTAEMVRVLKPSGSIFVDCGDKYSERTGGKHNSSDGAVGRGPQAGIAQQSRGPREKSLLLLPERYRIACVDELGLIARAVIVWDKPNGLPESVTDRVRRSHEDWVHLTKQPRYYSAVDEVREPHTGGAHAAGNGESRRWADSHHERGPRGHRAMATDPSGYNSLGKLPGSVWSIPSEPLQVPAHLGIDHYAAFPSEWPRRLILGWSPPGICCGCGQGRVPVVHKDGESSTERMKRLGDIGGVVVPNHRETQALNHAGHRDATRAATIVGHSCACTPYTDHPGTGGSKRRDYNPVPDARPQGTYGRHQAGEYEPVGPWREYHLDGWHPPPTRPAVVLDPFVGTGTVPMVARALGRHGVGVDLSADYLRLASWRVWHSGHAGKAESRTWTERQGSLIA